MKSLALLILTLAGLIGLSTSKTVFHEFHVHYVKGAPDGVFKESILTVNGRFPGPTVEAEVGDTIHVVVYNEIQDGQNVSMHWHGITQDGTPFEDGASLITQCPLKSGESQTYIFLVNKPGTFWYHSHTQSQYTEGLWGPLIVRSRNERFSYDGEIMISLSDWYHRTAHENEYWHIASISHGVPPYPDSALINGIGRYSCLYARTRSFLQNCSAELQERPLFRVNPTKTYRVRVINTAANSVFRFSIDAHKLQTIETDGVDVLEPVVADEAIISQGQRYSFLVEMTGDAEGEYLIRANLMSEILMLIVRENIAPYPEALQPNATAVLKYRKDGDEPSLPDVSTELFDYTQEVPESSLQNPLVLDPDLLRPADGIEAPRYYDKQFILETNFTYDPKGIRRGTFNGTWFTLPEHPIIMTVMEDGPIPAHVIPHFIELGDVVEVVINNPFKGPHPFHLHGHHFWVVGTGAEGDWDYDPRVHELRFDGARRDTIYVKQESW